MPLTGETCPICERPKGCGIDVPDSVDACFRNAVNCERFTLTARERKWRTRVLAAEAEALAANENSGRLEAAIRPFIGAFREKYSVVPARRKWFDTMPGHFTLTIVISMADGRAAIAALETKP